MIGKLLRNLFLRHPTPTGAHPRLQEGYAELLAERFEHARSIAAEILVASPSSFAGRVLMAQASAALSEDEAALRNAQAAIDLQPANPEGYYVRGLIHDAAGRAAQALADYDRVLQYHDGHQAALDKKGAIHDARGEFEASLACAERLVRIDPQNAEAHHKRAITLRELGRIGEAEASLRQAIALCAEFMTARAHLALILIELGRTAEADELLTGLLAAAPEHKEARWAAAVLHLLSGRYASGWEQYEARESRSDAKLRLATVPEWRGEPLVDGALMVNAEQGLGDQIMFSSCLPDVAASVSACVVSCDPRLQPIFERSFTGVKVVAMRSDRPLQAAELPLPIRAQTMLGSLPKRYRPCLDAFPKRAGYLRADPGAVTHWRERLAGLGPGLKIGLSWTGGTPKTRRSLRSLSLERLAPVLRVPGCQFVSLQYVDSRNEIDVVHTAHGVVVNDFPTAIADYDQTAALVSALDLVVTVCTAVVHLSGALGQRVWVLTPFIPEWRYLLDGEVMPWYPSAKLWRQGPDQCWDETIEAVATALATFRDGHRG